ncbi:glycerophosphodiester phosphodiesterase family protein [Marinibactrum halimedae]|uniref:glycerophosphodiester phosphodiesterase n=1 Tax=Marinibactrum halimedae TaxID=1444977 RepID=A0AA37T3I0_9GAMM|nr:glycerophosphodiester phosphodiesterase family protein [Marinibactrum halimedae]MCD9458661.1 glycerophosphodiester phosphodiesterase [Marinibactrum halimedae]GLS25973.1 glycerophosphoryl diester phosphodiesterase [Marinibactrum halimedae]
MGLCVKTLKVLTATVLTVVAGSACAGKHWDWQWDWKNNIDLGPRPTFLVEGMEESHLKRRLESCKNGPFYKTDFSIGHRGAPMQFPEHTKESYVAAAKMGAGILECDVSFTSDGELVCRHAQCDLHTTTNIILTDLNDQCSVPWNADMPNPESVKCCTSDITLAEFKTLEGKMDSFNQAATTAEEFVGGVADWRTGLYESRGTLLTHTESIKLFQKLGAKFTPELKGPDRAARLQVEDVFGSQANYAQKLADEYRQAGVSPHNVWLQSFNLEDVKYWIEKEPSFGRQAVYLDDRYGSGINPNDPSTFSPSMKELADQGVEIIAPPLWMLLKVTDNGKIVPSAYARAARKAGLGIITWTFERSDLRNGSRTGVDENGNPVATWYYQFDVNPNAQAINTDSDMYKALHVLAKDVKILGIFSDWPATVTYYANCMGL